MSKISNTTLNELNDYICCNAQKVIDFFGACVSIKNDEINGACPIHDGDNPRAFRLQLRGRVVSGFWRCYTKECEKVFGRNAIGWIRGLLSKKYSKWTVGEKALYSFPNTIKWITDFFQISLDRIPYCDYRPAPQDLAPKIIYDPKWRREDVRSRLIYPCQYYINRKYPAELLNKYDIGLCKKYPSPFYKRAVFPIYDNDGEYIKGFMARATDEYFSPKWIPNKNFHCHSYLFNYPWAKRSIEKTGRVYLVEGHGDVLRMVQYETTNVVGLFGRELYDRQLVLLERLGVREVTLLLDNDEAGKDATRKISEKLKYHYRLKVPEFFPSDIKDVGEMDKECLQKVILSCG